MAVSGAYGNDGLPCTISRLPVSFQARVRAEMIPLPTSLYELWANGGGWNSAGSEADEMRKWARETFIFKEKRK